MAGRRFANITLVSTADYERVSREMKQKFSSEEVQDAILPAAKIVRDTAKQYVNLGAGKGGHLRDFIFATKGKRAKGGLNSLADLIGGERGPSVIVGVDRRKAPHSHLIEFGHGGPHPAPAYPFLRPAVAATRGAAMSIIEGALKRMLAAFVK